MKITKLNSHHTFDAELIVIGSDHDLTLLSLSPDELGYVRTKREKEINLIVVNRSAIEYVLCFCDTKKEQPALDEHFRKKGSELLNYCVKEKHKTARLLMGDSVVSYTLPLLEGFSLSAYQYLSNFSDRSKHAHTFGELLIDDDVLSDESLADLQALTASVYWTRDLVNEPVLTLNATELARRFKAMAGECGFDATVFDQKKIEELRFGGLLAVNRGSLDEATFTILEHKPIHPVNSRPIILVGKGVVFDTGGLSLKPTPKSMDSMKCDMAGAATVASVLRFAALRSLPLHLMALIPATDNRPDGNAITPGDVITISNGTTVEVLNTDAEGRLILADALCYAQQFDPMLVIDVATLTGAVAVTLGGQGSAVMGSDAGRYMPMLIRSGFNVYERLVELPMWDEYGEMIKSTIADLKNIGGGEAGTITAAKFLQHFTTYPWMHIDIAGTAFQTAADSYRPAGGTGFGVRVLIDFLRSLAESEQ